MSPTRLEPPIGARDEAPATISTTSRFTWPIVVAIVGLALWAARAESTTSAASATASAAAKDAGQLQLRVQRVEDAQLVYAKQQEELKAMLQRLEEKLDRLRDDRRGAR